jgi:tagaturonate reductase
MQLSEKILSQLNGSVKSIPSPELFDLPEKILQFGTGVLLRALPDYFVDKANKRSVFNGRIVVVKSTDSSGTDAFTAQDGLYTVCIRGFENGKTIQEDIVNASISRVLSAKTEWKKILACAGNPEMKIVFSNTTEVGIQLVEDSITATPPVSFPGKLLAFLYERYKIFDGSAESGMVIVPTELITDNGSKLESIVLELAHRNKLDFAFIEWLENHNTFCNSLVDRIVPGRPNAADAKRIETALGYEDELLTMSEVFRLWAIEGDEKVKEVLSFSKIDDGVIIAPDITLFKELKLRLLNGTHSFNCGLAFLSGFNITREAVTDKIFSVFAKNLMHKEIARAIPYAIDENIKKEFADKVFERFCNSFIDHQWLSITVQYTSKMKMRNVPLLVKYFELSDTLPMHMATGFAGFLYFMKAVSKENGKYFGLRNGKEYEINDDEAEYFDNVWHKFTPEDLVHEVLANENLWGTDLTQLPGFENAVQEQLDKIMNQGALAVINELIDKKEMAR